MKRLVVTAHPLSNRFCKQLTDHVTDKLTEMGHEVILKTITKFQHKIDRALKNWEL